MAEPTEDPFDALENAMREHFGQIIASANPTNKDGVLTDDPKYDNVKRALRNRKKQKYIHLPLFRTCRVCEKVGLCIWTRDKRRGAICRDCIDTLYHYGVYVHIDIRRCTSNPAVREYFDREREIAEKDAENKNKSDSDSDSDSSDNEQ